MWLLKNVVSSRETHADGDVVRRDQATTAATMMTPTMTAAAAPTPAINVVLSDSETLVVVSIDLTVSSSVLSETRFVCTGLTRVGCEVVDSDVELAAVLDMVT